MVICSLALVVSSHACRDHYLDKIFRVLSADGQSPFSLPFFSLFLHPFPPSLLLCSNLFFVILPTNSSCLALVNSELSFKYFFHLLCSLLQVLAEAVNLIYILLWEPESQSQKQSCSYNCLMLSYCRDLVLLDIVHKLHRSFRNVLALLT